MLLSLTVGEHCVFTPDAGRVTGGTGSGKTFVCKLILEQLAASGLDPTRVQILSQDSFYRDLEPGG